MTAQHKGTNNPHHDVAYIASLTKRINAITP